MQVRRPWKLSQYQKQKYTKYTGKILPKSQENRKNHFQRIGWKFCWKIIETKSTCCKQVAGQIGHQSHPLCVCIMQIGGPGISVPAKSKNMLSDSLFSFSFLDSNPVLSKSLFNSFYRVAGDWCERCEWIESVSTAIWWTHVLTTIFPIFLSVYRL